MRQDIDISNLAYPVGRIPWRRFRAVLMTVHLWAGLILAIPFILLGISGSILVLQPEAPRWSIPAATATGAVAPCSIASAICRVSGPELPMQVVQP